MKNILIIETSRSDVGSGFNFFNDVNDIPDLYMRNSVIDAINDVENTQLNRRLEGNNREIVTTIDGMIFSEMIGYYFSNLTPRINPPYRVEHIVEHIID